MQTMKILVTHESDPQANRVVICHGTVNNMVKEFYGRCFVDGDGGKIESKEETVLIVLSDPDTRNGKIYRRGKNNQIGEVIFDGDLHPIVADLLKRKPSLCGYFTGTVIQDHFSVQGEAPSWEDDTVVPEKQFSNASDEDITWFKTVRNTLEEILDFFEASAFDTEQQWFRVLSHLASTYDTIIKTQEEIDE